MDTGEQTHLDIIESYDILMLKFLENKRETIQGNLYIYLRNIIVPSQHTT